MFHVVKHGLLYDVYVLVSSPRSGECLPIVRPLRGPMYVMGNEKYPRPINSCADLQFTPPPPFGDGLDTLTSYIKTADEPFLRAD